MKYGLEVSWTMEDYSVIIIMSFLIIVPLYRLFRKGIYLKLWVSYKLPLKTVFRTIVEGFILGLAVNLLATVVYNYVVGIDPIYGQLFTLVLAVFLLIVAIILITLHQIKSQNGKNI